MAKIIPKFYGKVQKGQLLIDDEANFRQHISTLKGIVEITVKNWRSTRSNQQNRYFHGPILDLICEHTGYEKQEMKEILKSYFLKDYKTIKTSKGEEVFEYIRPTSSLNTEEMCDFTDKVRRWAMKNLNVNIPDPDQISF